jgi:hypothetical protein
VPGLLSRPFRAMASSAALGLCLACSGIGTTRYVGTVTNGGLPASPGSLSLTLLGGTDTSFTGYVLIGPPLGGSGYAYGWFRGDTIKVLTFSESGDTIFWSSSRGGSTLGGRYSITGGKYARQGGAWSATLVRGPALTGGARPTTPQSSSGLPLVIFGTLVMAAAVVVATYWVRATPHHVPGPSSSTEGAGQQLQGVGGWMAWFLLGQVLTVALAVGRLISDWPPWTPESWALGNALPGLNLLVMI